MAVHRSTPPGSRAVGASSGGGLVQIDDAAIGELSRALHDLPAATQRGLKAVVADAAGVVADAAKQNASFSTWIPDAIVTRAPLSARASAEVRVLSSRAPSPDHAPLPRLMEFGSPSFRHPVFGRDTWVSQPGHPFLFPAVREKSTEVRDRVAEAVRTAAATVGLI